MTNLYGISDIFQTIIKPIEYLISWRLGGLDAEKISSQWTLSGLDVQLGDRGDWFQCNPVLLCSSPNQTLHNNAKAQEKVHAGVSLSLQQCLQLQADNNLQKLRKDWSPTHRQQLLAELLWSLVTLKMLHTHVGYQFWARINQLKWNASINNQHKTKLTFRTTRKLITKSIFVIKPTQPENTTCSKIIGIRKIYFLAVLLKKQITHLSARERWTLTLHNQRFMFVQIAASHPVLMPYGQLLARKNRN